MYPIIHLIRVDVLSHIDTPLTHEQLLAPDSTYTIVRPLTEKYLELQNPAIVFCLLLNKIQFEKDSQQLSVSTLSLSRATLCEILAIRVLRGWSERSLQLATVLLTPWALFQGASEEVREHAKEEGDEDLLTQGGTALEMAIISGSKRFIRSPSCQKVIEGIWSGKIIYSALNTHALIADNYKKKPIQMYNPHKAPLLDHYRLKVPRIRSALEYFNFLILFITYVLAIEGMADTHLNWREGIFIVYALSFSLDKLAAIREHGLKVFSSSLVNGFDLVFMLIYAVYLTARTYGFHYGDPAALALGSDWLAMGALLIFPRLAFVTLANNLLILSLRSMMSEFFFLMGVGFFCFLGFLYALFTLGQGRFELLQIGWWLLDIYFGLDASGFEAAHRFHPLLGPVIMITYALLSNTLLLTVLVAILGNTFATINADASAESMFRKAVSTIEGVKADAVFSYQLPFNLVAVVFMWPMYYILNPRWFHKLNVFMIRASNLPVLLAIGLYERQRYRETSLMEQFGDFTERYVGSLPRRIKAAAGFDTFGSQRDVGIVFEIEREVGSFYKGWEDDVLDDEPFLPEAAELPTDEERADDMNGQAVGITPTTQMKEDDDASEQMVILPTSRSDPVTASPARLEHDTSASPSRNRRQSMPAQESPSFAVPFPPVGPRPRRNSSIHEPSPLARLFLRDNDDGRGRRTSAGLALSSSMGSMSSMLSGAKARTRSHRKSDSQPLPQLQLDGRRFSKQPIQPIEEGKKVSFIQPAPVARERERDVSPNTDEPVVTERGYGSTGSFAAAGRALQAAGEHDSDRDEPSVRPSTRSKRIAKASEVQESMSDKEEMDTTAVVGSVDERLRKIDERQSRIEDMLKLLLEREGGTGQHTRGRTS